MRFEKRLCEDGSEGGVRIILTRGMFPEGIRLCDQARASERARQHVRGSRQRSPVGLRVLRPSGLFQQVVGLRALACSLVLCTLLSFHVKADISPLPDPVIEKYLDEIAKPTRTLHLTGSQAEPAIQTLKVLGPISDDDIRSLLPLPGYHRPTVYSIVGDARYARLRAGQFCGPLCGSGTDLVFRRDPLRVDLPTLEGVDQLIIQSLDPLGRSSRAERRGESGRPDLAQVASGIRCGRVARQFSVLSWPRTDDRWPDALAVKRTLAPLSRDRTRSVPSRESLAAVFDEPTRVAGARGHPTDGPSQARRRFL